MLKNATRLSDLHSKSCNQVDSPKLSKFVSQNCSRMNITGLSKADAMQHDLSKTDKALYPLEDCVVTKLFEAAAAKHHAQVSEQKTRLEEEPELQIEMKNDQVCETNTNPLRNICTLGKTQNYSNQTVAVADPHMLITATNVQKASTPVEEKKSMAFHAQDADTLWKYAQFMAKDSDTTSANWLSLVKNLLNTVPVNNSITITPVHLIDLTIAKPLRPCSNRVRCFQRSEGTRLITIQYRYHAASGVVEYAASIFRNNVSLTSPKLHKHTGIRAMSRRHAQERLEKYPLTVDFADSVSVKQLAVYCDRRQKNKNTKARPAQQRRLAKLASLNYVPDPYWCVFFDNLERFLRKQLLTMHGTHDRLKEALCSMPAFGRFFKTKQ